MPRGDYNQQYGLFIFYVPDPYLINIVIENFMFNRVTWLPQYILDY